MHSCPMNFNIPIFITAYTSIVCSNEAIISLTQDVNDAYVSLLDCVTGRLL